jgi:Nucleotidyl transferase AbiEii toxin, Type IV TA system
LQSKPDRLILCDVFPTLLDFPAPVLSGYSRETAIVEKLQALVQLPMLNTRMKDYSDL